MLLTGRLVEDFILSVAKHLSTVALSTNAVIAATVTMSFTSANNYCLFTATGIGVQASSPALNLNAKFKIACVAS